MSATFLEFLERKTAERRATASLPEWASVVGYEVVAFRVPQVGEFFYAPIRDKILLCREKETQPFAIVEYRGCE